MHTHFSAVAAGGIFLAVLVWGTFWRLLAAHMCNNSRPAIANIGKAMSFQY